MAPATPRLKPGWLGEGAKGRGPLPPPPNPHPQSLKYLFMQKYQYKISDNEIKEALLRSGYLLESRLEEILRKNYYYVEANSAYADPAVTR